MVSDYCEGYVLLTQPAATVEKFHLRLAIPLAYIINWFR